MQDGGRLRNTAAAAKTTPDQLIRRIEQLEGDVKALRSENESLKNKIANASAGNIEDNIKEVGGVKLLTMAVEGVDMNGLRNLGDQWKEKLGEGVIVAASAMDGKVNLIVMATDAAMKAGAHAGNMIKLVAKEVGGGGGGRPNMAQAGGKNPAGVPAALAKAEEELRRQIGG